MLMVSLFWNKEETKRGEARGKQGVGGSRGRRKKILFT